MEGVTATAAPAGLLRRWCHEGWQGSGSCLKGVGVHSVSCGVCCLVPGVAAPSASLRGACTVVRVAMNALQLMHCRLLGTGKEAHAVSAYTCVWRNACGLMHRCCSHVNVHYLPARWLLLLLLSQRLRCA